jgi:hypothetical protein
MTDKLTDECHGYDLDGNPNTEAQKIAGKWVAEFGLGFHPDTRGRDYVEDGNRCLTDAKADEYDSDMDRLFKVAADPYKEGLEAMKAAGIID